MTPLERAASAVVTSKELFVESVLRDDSPILEGDPPKTIFSQPMIDDLVPGYLIRLRRTFVVLAFVCTLFAVPHSTPGVLRLI
jgi:hypothetical protein